VNLSSHLPPEHLFGYEHQILTPDELRSVHEHIAQCEDCRKELARRIGVETMEPDLRNALAGAKPPRRVASRVWLAYAAAAAILLAIGLAVWLQNRDRTVQDALRSGSISIPGFVKDLNPPREVLMGQTADKPASLISPKGTGVLSRHPSFLWRSLGDGWTYRVQVFDSDGALAAESPALTATVWNCDRALAREQTYEWQLIAFRGEERVTLEKPPESPARFRVVDASTATRIEKLVAAKRTHLELAVEFGRAGLLEDARREMAAAITQHPADPAIERLRDSLQPPK
jgi:hypothetical protein